MVQPFSKVIEKPGLSCDLNLALLICLSLYVLNRFEYRRICIVEAGDVATESDLDRVSLRQNSTATSAPLALYFVVSVSASDFRGALTFAVWAYLYFHNFHLCGPCRVRSYDLLIMSQLL